MGITLDKSNFHTPTLIHILISNESQPTQSPLQKTFSHPPHRESFHPQPCITASQVRDQNPVISQPDQKLLSKTASVTLTKPPPPPSPHYTIKKESTPSPIHASAAPDPYPNPTRLSPSARGSPSNTILFPALPISQHPNPTTYKHPSPAAPSWATPFPPSQKI